MLMSSFKTIGLQMPKISWLEDMIPATAGRDSTAKYDLKVQRRHQKLESAAVANSLAEEDVAALGSGFSNFLMSSLLLV